MNASEPSPALPPSRLGLAPSTPKPSRQLPTARPPPATPPPQRPRVKKPPLTLGGWLLRALTVLPLLGSAFVVFWSYQRLTPVQHQTRNASAQISRLSTEIGLMQGRLTPEELAKLAADYQRAQGLLFSGPDALKDWFEELRVQMIPLALDASADIGRAVVTNSSNFTVAVVPATVALTIQPSPAVEGVRSPYERVLRFLDEINHQDKRVDVVELQVTGGSNSVNRAVATLRLWAGEEVKP